ncbi:putative Zn finger protein [Murinocardiopsis flavida]|uniref:Putative Zn finger protein n=1 Tax=Murinocardiopsis flavida TaxID=645275 RepID=A0A2P8D924_9ACTN|nr:SWIM zinc finger family protein [Murinocardiopsis flavida]PSK93728.1 putative Zn finger protein [Murinocardiopsis flavida]
MSGRAEEQARAFAALPPQRGRGRFAHSWWGNAWIEALEDTALDQAQLKQGRRLARAGQVGAIVVSPGRIEADVHSRAESFHAVVGVERLDAAAWERFLDQVAAKAGHIAALLDKDMPHDLVEVAADAGVRLLPGIGELEPECECPGWELPCAHAAALAYQAARLLDEDPFVLLLIRGRGDRELLEGLSQRNARRAAAAGSGEGGDGVGGGGAGGADRAAGVAAGAAFARPVPPLPDPPEPPAPGPLPVQAAAPGLEPDALGVLAADTAARARELLTPRADAHPWDAWPDPHTGAPPSDARTDASPAADRTGALSREVWADTVRLAAAHRGPAVWERLRAAAPGRDLDAAVRAWECGGAAGLQVWEAPWTPPGATMARARTALDALWSETGGQAQVWRNRCTAPAGDAQVRYGPDGRWHPYRRSGAQWRPSGPADRDPAAALAEDLGP